MYNGIGLTTPRGSGTNGYVMRNLSVLRNHKTPEDRAAVWNAKPPQRREPDPAILEHERRRNVELKCLELRLDLEEKNTDPDALEEQVTALRKRLLDALPPAVDPKTIKPSDTHALGIAKKQELDKMARALGTRADYQEGDAFNQEKQEENRVKRMLEREERDRRREEERANYEKQKEQWAAEKKERDRLRRREEDRLRKLREQEAERNPPHGGRSGGQGRDARETHHERRSRSPPRRDPERRETRRDDSRRRFQSRSPRRRRSISPAKYPPRQEQRSGRYSSPMRPPAVSPRRRDTSSGSPRPSRKRARSASASPPRNRRPRSASAQSEMSVSTSASES